LVSLRYGFLFVHVPKTGGTSVQAVLAPYADDRIVVHGHQDGIERFGVEGPYTPDKHAPLSAYQARLSADQFSRLFKFATVRNPFERVMSLYFSPGRWLRDTPDGWRATEPQWSRDAFLEIVRKTPAMTSYLNGPLDDVLRFESLADDAQRVFRRLGIDGTLPHRNAGLLPERARFYDAELREFVRKRFAGDFAAFYPDLG
jgi:hypothetical protein